MNNFRTLDLAKILYQQSKSIKLKAHAKDQLERALLSICFNLAEGNSRHTPKERHRFFNIALGSLREAQILIELESLSNLQNIADHCGASLYKLLKQMPK